MDDTAYRKFFTCPKQTYQRRYEALRAVFVNGRSQKEVAEELGYTYGAMRQLVFEFRRRCKEESQTTACFFFETARPSRRSTPLRRTTSQTSSRR